MDSQELHNRFTYHPPKGDQPGRYGAVREAGLRLAEEITALSPESRARSLALTKVEEAVMWANAAIARRE